MLKIKVLVAKCIMLGALFTPFSGAASIKVNVHQLDNWWWTAPATPVIELGVVNDGEQRVGCRVELAVTTDMHRPVCTPHTNFAGYNLIRSSKQFIIYPNCGHDTEHPEWDNRQVEFFKQNMVK